MTPKRWKASSVLMPASIAWRTLFSVVTFSKALAIASASASRGMTSTPSRSPNSMSPGLMRTPPISIVTPKGRADEAAYAAANTGAILAATEHFFGQPYPFPKLDLVAYPRSTFGGAMENPGLITYAARILLARPDEMSPAFEQRFVGVTAHEIAHMWFGDYVTMAWWNDLWLNESFASWLSSKVAQELRPD